MARDYLSEAGFYFRCWYNQVTITSEDLASSGTKWLFSGCPVSMQELEIFGVPSGATETGSVLSYTVQPLSGVLDVSGSYTSINANYRYYQNSVLLTPGGDGKWDETQSIPPLFRTISGQPKYYLTKNYPEKLDISIVIPSESYKAYVSGPMYNSKFFLLIDEEQSMKAYEGPVASPKVHNVCKGDDIICNITIYVSSYGNYNLTASESGTAEIVWKMW